MLLVAPTGSGKTRMGQELVALAVREGVRVLWLVHRDELLTQSRDVLLQLGVPVGIVAAGREANPNALIQVASIQTLAARDVRPEALLVVFDEAHHYVSEEWGAVAKHYEKAVILGLTATPERSDGRPLGDLFDELVQAASYGELVRSGHLVPCRVFRPGEALGNGLGKDPLSAYQSHGDSRQGFVFTGTIEEAKSLRDKFETAGITTECIHQGTPRDDRGAIIRAFRNGSVRLLTNVYTLTEGIDVPQASVCVLARGIGHVSPYLQMVGRVLRPHDSKRDAILIDLPGASHQHGLPTEDREYSLGDGIKRSKQQSLTVCMRCGFTFEGGGKCPSCGFSAFRDKKRNPRIYDMILQEVYAGAETPAWAKQRELQRMREIGLPIGAVIRQYAELFGERPNLGAETSEVARGEYRRLVKQAEIKGYAKGWAAYRFKAVFGSWPNRAWG